MQIKFYQNFMKNFSHTSHLNNWVGQNLLLIQFFMALWFPTRPLTSNLHVIKFGKGSIRRNLRQCIFSRCDKQHIKLDSKSKHAQELEINFLQHIWVSFVQFSLFYCWENVLFTKYRKTFALSLTQLDKCLFENIFE